MTRLTRFLVLLLAAAPLLLASDPMITTMSLPQGVVGESYNFQFQAMGGVLPYTWDITGLPLNLTADAAGHVTGQPAHAGMYSVHAIVHDAQNFVDGYQYDLIVNNPPLAITTTSLPNGKPGIPYSGQVNAAGGAPPYYFSFGQGGAVPPGLMMDPNGQIVGTPTMLGVYDTVVQVSDSMENFAQRMITIVIGDPLRFTTPLALPDATAGQSYGIAIMADGGQPPYIFQFVELPPTGLTLTKQGGLTGTPPIPGDLMIPIQLIDNFGTTLVNTFTLHVAGAPPVLQPSLQDLEFTALQGGDPPPAQSVTIVPSGSKPSSYQIDLETGAGSAALRAAAPTWLHVDPAAGQVPARFTVSVDQSGLAAGTYPARIFINTANDPTRDPFTVGVTLNVESQPQQLEVTPNPLKFSAVLAKPGKQEQSLVLRNSGGGGPVPFTALVTGASRWITLVSPNSGQTTPGQPLLVRVQVDSTGLALGQYRDVIRFVWSGQPIDVPVTLFVSGTGPVLDLDVDGVRFRTREGNGLATTRQVHVINRGTATSMLQWKAEITRGGEWLSLEQSPDPVTPAAPGLLTLRLLPAASTLTAGAYYALVKVSDNGALNSPQYVTVVLEVASRSAPTLLDFDPTGVLFIVPPGPTARTAKLSISASSVVPVAFQAAASTIDGQGWLSVTPVSGAVSSTQTTDLTISVNPTLLNPGIYHGEIDLGRSGEVRSVNITVIVAQGAADAPAIPKNAAAAGCAPSRLALTQTGLPNHFSLPAGWPASVILKVNDDCGSSVTGASVSASFSNGDPPLSLTGDGAGVYSATWQPGTSMQQVNMTVRANAAGLTATSSLLIGDVSPNTVPVLNRNGTVNNLNPKTGGALSPGLVASVYGSGLAAVAESTGAVPLLTNYKETSVIIGPYEVPLYFVSPTQVNVELPAELAANQQYSIVVSANGALTVPDLIDVVPVEPGIATFSDGRLIAQHNADYTLVDDAHPAKRGEFLIMYLIGLGETNPTVASGTPSPGNPLAVPVDQPVLTIDGQPVEIFFAGLTPGGVGLFQINFKVPDNARTGTPLDVVVKQGDVQANVATLMVTN